MNKISAPFQSQFIDLINQVQVGVSNEQFKLNPIICHNRSGGLRESNGIKDYSGASHGTVGHIFYGNLIAESCGMVCPYCGYTQNWAIVKAVPLDLIKIKKGMTINSLHDNDENKVELIKNINNAMSIYKSLHQNHIISEWQTLYENEKTLRIWSLTEIMLISLNRRLLAVCGITSIPGQSLRLDETWINVNLSLPRNGDVVQVLVQGNVLHPLRHGFRVNAWIDTSVLVDKNNFLISLTTDGYVTHWRKIIISNEL